MINIKDVAVKQTSKGSDYKALTLDDGKMVNMWSDDPDYALAIPGAELHRNIYQEGKYWNLIKIAVDKPKSNWKSQEMEKTMASKNQYIQQSMDKKEEAIKMASTIRMAVDIVNAQSSSYKNYEDIQAGVKFWREFLWKEWDNVGGMPPF